MGSSKLDEVAREETRFSNSVYPNTPLPDDLDDVILDKMIKEAGIFYKMELEKQRK